MPRYICKACGVQRAKTDTPPVICPICADPRQFVPASGQVWMDPGALSGHGNVFRRIEPGIIGIRTIPEIGIGQRALLLQTEAGNVL